jgi:ATP phosphoribosyltransferase regulatory subunit
MDLRTLLRLGAAADDSLRPAIYAPPCSTDPVLEMRVSELRRRGERVIRALPGADPGPCAFGCDRLLVRQNGGWAVVPVVA